MAHEARPVASYGEYSSKVDELLAYPGARPEGSFMLSAESVVELPDDFDQFQEVANESLSKAGQPPLEDRIAILAYGANANPPRVIAKLEKYGVVEDHVMMPFASVSVPDVAAVWHGRPDQSGSIFAELYKGSETEGGELRTHLSFVTEEQAAVIHASEGATYSLAEMQVSTGGERQLGQKALAYVGLDATVLTKDGSPLAVEGLANNLPLESMTAEEAVDYILAQDGVAEVAGATNARELVEQGIALKLSEKKIRQNLIGAQLARLGVARDYRYPAESTDFIGRLAFDAQKGHHPEFTESGAQFVEIAGAQLAGLRTPKGQSLMKVLAGRAVGEIEIGLRSAE
jgi:hypothetical protein